MAVITPQIKEFIENNLGWITTMNKRELKQLLAGLTHANISVRNSPLTVAQLRKKLKLKDGGNTYLFATTDAQGRHLVLRTKKRKSGSL